MKIYLAGPLFTTAERDFNTRLAKALEARRTVVWLPQDNEPRDKTAEAIFAEDVRGIDWADVVAANMDGPDPDSGTAWECGYAYAKRKGVVLFRTDFRGISDGMAPYNLMLSGSGATCINLPLATIPVLADAIADAIVAALEQFR